MMHLSSLNSVPVYVLLGTKAQYIKTAPLLRLMQRLKIDYTLIDTGQHAAFLGAAASTALVEASTRQVLGSFWGWISRSV